MFPSDYLTKLFEAFNYKSAYYHGTSNDVAGEAIWKSKSLRPGLEKRSWKSLAPIENQTYMTPELEYGLTNAFGGLFDSIRAANHVVNLDKGQYAWLCVMKGIPNTGVLPDEDFVGAAIAAIFLYVHGDENSMREHLGPENIKTLKSLDILAVKHIYNRIKSYYLTEKQYRKLIDTYTDTVTIYDIGKRVLIKAAKDKPLIDFFLNTFDGFSVSVNGAVKIDELWRMPKTDIGKLSPKGRNFFKIAERLF